MRPHTHFRFHPRVVQIGCYWGNGGHTELYLVEGDTLALIDTGVSDTPTQYIGPALEACGRTLADVDLILNTHGHHDHAGGNAELVAASQAPVWIHEADARVAEDLDYQFEMYFANRDRLTGRPDRLARSRAALQVTAGASTPVGRTLTDGDVIDLGKGIRLRVIHVPGHTRGSVCYYWESEGMVFSGDAVMGQGSRPGGFPLIYFPAEYLESIQRLVDMDIAILALGHHYRTLSAPPDSIHFGEGVGTYLVASRTIAEIIETAVRRAVAADPAADFLHLARAATEIAGERLTIAKDEDGLPHAGGVETLNAYWSAVKTDT